MPCFFSFLSTRGDLAKHLYLRPSAISRILTGQRDIKNSEAIQISAFLGVPLSEFLKKTGIDSGLVSQVIKADRAEPQLLYKKFPAPSLIAEEGAGSTWGIPANLLGQKTNSPLKNLAMIEVKDDCMAPTLAVGARVLVDYQKTSPSPAGIFLIGKGDGYSFRRGALVPQTAKKILRLSADNAFYRSDEFDLKNSPIKARVIAIFSWV